MDATSPSSPSCSFKFSYDMTGSAELSKASSELVARTRGDCLLTGCQAFKEVLPLLRNWESVQSCRLFSSRDSNPKANGGVEQIEW
ncbi:hypothetical protein MHYP_G00325530 [Metynnis hypsauchen]